MNSRINYPTALSLLCTLNHAAALRAASYLEKKAGSDNGHASCIVAIEVYKKGSRFAGSSCSVNIGALPHGSEFSGEAFRRISALKDRHEKGFMVEIASSMILSPLVDLAGCIASKGRMDCTVFVSTFGLATIEANEVFSYHVSRWMGLKTPAYENQLLIDAPDVQSILSAQMITA